MSRCLYLEYGSACNCGPCRRAHNEFPEHLTPEQRVVRLRQALAELGEHISPEAEEMLLEMFRQDASGVPSLTEGID